jgi:WD40 repeat protein
MKVCFVPPDTFLQLTNNPNLFATLQVRIWDIKENACVNMIILNQTIISVAFHPAGEYIAVACGMRIELWEWRVPLSYHEEVPQLPNNTPFAPNSKHLRHNAFSEDGGEDEDGEDSPLTRSITHKRNIRAVLFHPSGDYIFAVAPDAPKQNNEELSHCK